MLLDQITAAGIVGCGGAGFPTAVKYNTKTEYFIINAAECEPLLKTDHYVMNNYAKECVEAIAAVGEMLEAQHIVIATKAYYTKEIAALEKAIQELGAPVTIFKMKNFYPAGDEQIMVYEVTGRTVPPGGIPIEVGCVISNIATMLNIYQARQGKNVTHKLLTITGAVREPKILEVPIPIEVGCVISNIATMLNIYQARQGKNVTHKLLTITGAVREPKILEVPIGTSFDECLALAGGTTLNDFMFINGGPMMGKTGVKEDFSQQVVTKTTSGIIIMEKRDFIYELHEKEIPQMINKARSSCIQCRLCTELCPRYQIGHPIHPHRVMRHLTITDVPDDIDDDPIWKEACIQCRLCTELCPRYQIGHPIHPHRVMRHLTITDVPDDIDDDPIWKEALLCCECGICETIACPMGLLPRQVNKYVKQRLAEKGIRYKKDERPLTPSPMRDYQLVPPVKILLKDGLKQYADFTIEKLQKYEPKQVRIPLRMHIGAPCEPVLQIGDRVRAGELIGRKPEKALGADIHASIDGIVTAVSASITIERRDN